ncbi:hypothetical protein ACI01nite_04890 [Acetobacter cibinongensis]|uniref:Uncharacterized protein n=1 Tax=Acetobacter cibinongensis TaxID=146475 RepID=A0A0D6N5G0_9PROT|nr:hypothetical protein Abci_018_089 [Acetobacter cibinongensis]GBQ17289.1 hypothetical protein AA0482_1861 [Acetobacter cibinongensis NRIC 0482]GEL57887.1 hypothetical protein ACI01nite_04890 [Acetobacter cibinongensis]
MPIPVTTTRLRPEFAPADCNKPARSPLYESVWSLMNEGPDKTNLQA